MVIKIIKTEEDYREAMVFIQSLMDREEDLSDIEIEQLEVVAKLIEDYETIQFPIDLPDPIEAIKFRMDQQGLVAEDLVKYIGSRSKVSEVLSGKRPLSINMVNMLKEGLGIPAEVLLNQKRIPTAKNKVGIEYPLKEMVKRGYINVKKNASTTIIEDKISSFLRSLLAGGSGAIQALFRKSTYVRTARPMNKGALLVWMAQVVRKADSKVLSAFDRAKLSGDFVKKLVSLSKLPDGIEKSISMLEDIGIHVVYEPQLPSTYIDGAAIMLEGKNPIIALTARQDRLDNYWFTLLHELSHIMLHSNQKIDWFIDDLEIGDENKQEIEADSLASESMVPEQVWSKSLANILPNKDSITILAKELGVHPAIVAGKARFMKNKYHILVDMVGSGEVRAVLAKISK